MWESHPRIALARILLQMDGPAVVLCDEPGLERELRSAHRLFAELGPTGRAKRLARELAP